MKMLNRVITGGYWGAYYLVYVLGVAFLVYYFWDELLFLETRHLYVETLFLIGAIYAVSAGTALFVAIIVEVTGRMVLLIPRAWNRAKDEGRAEGLAQGRTEGRAEGRAEGLAEGLTEGRATGLTVGRAEGLTEGRATGLTVGRAEGLTEGRAEGRAEGLTEGLTEGRAEGRSEERGRVQAILFQYARRDPETGRLVLDQDAEERLLNGKG